MATLKIYEVEEREVQVQGQPKKVKKCVIQEEGKQYPYKNVTVWDDYAEYNGVQAGASFAHSYIEAKDSNQINQNSGKPYKNYTLKYNQGQQKLSGDDAVSVQLARIEAKLDQVLKQKVDTSYDNLTDDIPPSEIPF